MEVEDFFFFFFFNSEQQEWGITHTQRKHGQEIKNIRGSKASKHVDAFVN